MQNIEEVFKYIKANQFLQDYGKINPNGGIRHRLTGKGTKEVDKQKNLNEKDKQVINTGLIQLILSIIKLIKPTAFEAVKKILEEDGD